MQTINAMDCSVTFKDVKTPFSNRQLIKKIMNLPKQIKFFLLMRFSVQIIESTEYPGQAVESIQEGRKEAECESPPFDPK